MPRMIPGETYSKDIDLNLINDTSWTLSTQADKHPWRMIVVYRGLHCPVCKGQLKELSECIEDMAAKGVTIVAASMDTQAKAEQTQAEWDTGALPIAYGLKRGFAEDFGLYLSNGISDKEPDLFTEPAILLFKGETFHAAWVQTIPFSRPNIDAIMDGIAYSEKNDYPARGTAKPQ